MRRPSHLDPPRSLKERVADLRQGLQNLGEKLKGSISQVVASAVADFIHDLVRRLLAHREKLPWRRSQSRRARDSWQEPEDPWSEEDEDPSWPEEGESLWLPSARLEEDKPHQLSMGMVLEGLSWGLLKLENHSLRTLVLAAVASLGLLLPASPSVQSLAFLTSALALAG